MIKTTENPRDQRAWYFSHTHVFIDLHAKGFSGKHFSKRFLQYAKRITRVTA